MHLLPKINRLLIRIRDSSVLRLLLLVLVIVLVYWQDFIVVAADSLNELSNYIIAIPFLIGILIYKNRRVIKAKASLEHGSRRHDIILGGLLLVTAFLIYWVGSYTFLPLEYHLLSLPMFIGGTLMLLYSRTILSPLFFPLAMLIFLEPFPSYLTDYLGSAFAYFSASASLDILSLIRIPAYFTIISGTPVIAVNTLSGEAINFGVTTECSGIYSLTGFAVFAAFAGYISIGSIYKRILLFALGFPLVYLLNILRVTLIVSAGYQLGAGQALQLFHMLAGSTLIFLTTFLLLITGERFWHLRFVPAKAKQICQSCNLPLSLKRGFCDHCSRLLGTFRPKISKSWFVPVILVILVISLFLSTQTPVYAITTGPRSFTISQLSANPANQSILPQIPSWHEQFVYRDTQIEQTSGFDAALVYDYTRNTTSPETRVYVLMELSRSPIHHTWESSLVIYPASRNHTVATIFSDNDIQLSNGPFVAGRFLTFIRQGSTVTETVIFWNQQIPTKSESGFQTEYAQISLLVVDDDLNARGLISPPYYSATSQNQLKTLLLPFALDIINYWRPQQTHAILTNLFGQNGLLTIGILGFAPLSLYFGVEIVVARAKTLSNRKIYSRLASPSEMAILQAVKLINKHNEIASLEKISEQLNQLPNLQKQFDHSTIYEILETAEQAGLVKKVMKTVNNEAYVSWRADF